MQTNLPHTFWGQWTGYLWGPALRTSFCWHGNHLVTPFPFLWKEKFVVYKLVVMWCHNFVTIVKVRHIQIFDKDKKVFITTIYLLTQNKKLYF